MIKRIMSITLVVALVLSQAGIASAFTSDHRYGFGGDKGNPFTAKVTIAGSATATLTVVARTITTDAIAPDLLWAGVNITDVEKWVASTEYLAVTYTANQIGWGVQLYTDNMNGSASPKYPGDPTTDPSKQPGGLIGVSNSNITCPLVTLVTNTPIAAGDIETPIKTTTADLPVLDPAYALPGEEGYAEWFTSGYNEVVYIDPVTLVDGREKVWFWLKDKSGTTWVDLNTDGDIDLTGSYGGVDYELVATFDDTAGDDGATIVNTLGSSSGWTSAGSGDMLRDPAADSPLAVYFAADFTNANELQEYKTNAIEVEIYHE